MNLNSDSQESAFSETAGEKILRGAYLHRAGEVAEDEDRIATFLEAGGFEVVRLENASERYSIQPDFLLKRNGHPWAYCEVKTMWHHRWRVRVLKEEQPVSERMEESSKAVPERVGDDLILAARQLRSANLEHAIPNVVALVNRDPEASPNLLLQDFWERPPQEGRSLSARIALRRAEELRRFRKDVDLCIWFSIAEDASLQVDGYFLFNSQLNTLVNELGGLAPEKQLSLGSAA